MGYDFHLAAMGPKLIEVNSNAGGAFLNALLAKAQRACCAEVEVAPGGVKADDFDGAVARMFQHEWLLQRKTGAPKLIAIVDERPDRAIPLSGVSPGPALLSKAQHRGGDRRWQALHYEHGKLLVERTTRRSISSITGWSISPSSGPSTRALRAAYLDGAVVVTPNPHVHALYADKRN